MPTLPQPRLALLLANAALWLAAAPAHAQSTLPVTVAPVISRMCLWNADKVTWKALGLKRDQVLRMDELRALYPAVVNGQWGGDPEPGAALTPQMGTILPEGVSDVVPASPVGLSVEQGPTSVPASLPAGGLQQDLRAVLTMKQLVAWDRLCNLH